MHIFVVPGNGQALVGMPDLETQDVLRINCNTIDMQTEQQQIHIKKKNRQQCTNNAGEAGKIEV